MKPERRRQDAPDADAIDPYDPRRADKWGYTDDEIRRIIPGLQPTPEESATPEEEGSDVSTEPRQRRA
jgi:hypothetical protein